MRDMKEYQNVDKVRLWKRIIWQYRKKVCFYFFICV